MDETLEPLTVGLSFGLALGSALALTPLARAIAHRMNIVDRPDGRRKLQEQPVALLGGLAVLGALVATLAALGAGSALGPFAARLPWLVAGVVLVCAVGICDDCLNLRARWKFAGQIVACLPLVAGGFTIDAISFGGNQFELGPFAGPASLLWFLTCINALNLIDGMDGLAATVGLWIAAAAAAAGGIVSATGPSLLALALAGSLAGFLVFNRPPASIYLGDAGSMTIGLATAVTTLLVSEDSPGVAHVTVMLALMSIPLADLALAVWRRSMSGTGFWHADRGHMHHRLQETGLTNRQILGVMTVLLLATGSLAVASRRVGWERLAWGASLVLAVSLVRSQLIGHHEWLLTKTAVRRRWLGQSLAPTQAAPVGARVAPPGVDDAPLELHLATAGQQLLGELSRLAAGIIQLDIELVTRDDRRHVWQWRSMRSARPAPETAVVTRLQAVSGLWSLRAALANTERIAPTAGDVAAELQRWMEEWPVRLAPICSAEAEEHRATILPLSQVVESKSNRRVA